MHSDVPCISPALKAARRAPANSGAALETGLPVWVGLSCSLTPEGEVHMLSEVEPTAPSELDFLETHRRGDVSRRLSAGRNAQRCALHKPGAEGCALKMARPSRCLRQLRHLFRGIRGRFREGRWPPDTYLQHVHEWVELGARVVGGCCGVGREHIRLISQALHPG